MHAALLQVLHVSDDRLPELFPLYLDGNFLGWRKVHGLPLPKELVDRHPDSRSFESVWRPHRRTTDLKHYDLLTGS